MFVWRGGRHTSAPALSLHFDNGALPLEPAIAELARQDRKALDEPTWAQATEC